MKELSGRVALVTGAASGIGAATASALASAGASVLLTDVSDDEGARQAATVSLHAPAAYRRLDVTDMADWLNAIAEAEKRFGGLDILVNNAGIFWLRTMAETTLDDFRRMQAINVDGVFLGMKTALPALAKRAGQWPGGASIVNLSSIAGITGAPLAVAYNASKGAVRLMTKGAALECASLGLKIRVNSVHPGVIDTPMGRKVIDDLSAAAGPGSGNAIRDQVIAQHPLGRLGTAEEIAQAILFLCSDRASFMTGSELTVDGGVTAR